MEQHRSVSSYQDLQFRPGRMEDRNQLEALNALSAAEPRIRGIHEKDGLDPSDFFVCEDVSSRQLAGFLYFKEEGKVARMPSAAIKLVYVAPRCRHQGIGSGLALGFIEAHRDAYPSIRLTRPVSKGGEVVCARIDKAYTIVSFYGDTYLFLEKKG